MTAVSMIRCDTCHVSREIVPGFPDSLEAFALDGVNALGEMRHICPSCRDRREQERWARYKSEIIQELRGQS